MPPPSSPPPVDPPPVSSPPVVPPPVSPPPVDPPSAGFTVRVRVPVSSDVSPPTITVAVIVKVTSPAAVALPDITSEPVRLFHTPLKSVEDELTEHVLTCPPDSDVTETIAEYVLPTVASGKVAGSNVKLPPPAWPVCTNNKAANATRTVFAVLKSRAPRLGFADATSIPSNRSCGFSETGFPH